MLLRCSACVGRISMVLLSQGLFAHTGSGSARPVPRRNPVIPLLSFLFFLGAAAGTEGIVDSIGSEKNGFQPNKSRGKMRMYSTRLHGHHEYHEQKRKKTMMRGSRQLRGKRKRGTDNIFDHASDNSDSMDERDNVLVHPSVLRTQRVGAGGVGGYKKSKGGASSYTVGWIYHPTYPGKNVEVRRPRRQPNPAPRPEGGEKGKYRPPRPPGPPPGPRPPVPRPRPQPQQRPTRKPNSPQKIPNFCTRCKKKICNKNRKIDFCGTTIGDIAIGCFPQQCDRQRRCTRACKKYYDQQFCKTRNRCDRICSTNDAIFNCENLIDDLKEYDKCKRKLDNCCCPPFARTPPPATATPTSSPSRDPSASPSSSPSSSPSALPSPSPSDEPSRLPSSSPSRLPSSSPSDVPSNIPSSSPSANPSVSHQPTTSLRPSSSPSFSDPPTTSPMPSQGPSTTPSISPSGEPSLVPSVEPSRLPSTSPSDAPTTFPSVSPSVLPSVIPSHIPSLSPSDAPSHLPSMVPSTSPSQSPSNEPSLLPSSSPSVQPSSEPSDMPSNGPTETCAGIGAECNLLGTDPSLTCCRGLAECIVPAGGGTPRCLAPVTPSDPPSAAPSSTPSQSCNLDPLALCVNGPNDPNARCCPGDCRVGQPCDWSGERRACQLYSNNLYYCDFIPSESPSSDPSSEPSLLPSADPSVAPSDEPSLVPSVAPSMLPSASPSDEPSHVPSTSPSSLPSSQPSFVPSYTPSTMPSSSPSSSFMPSADPSIPPCDVCADVLPPGDIVGSDGERGDYDSCLQLSNQLRTNANLDISIFCQTTSWIDNNYCERTCSLESNITRGGRNCCPCASGTQDQVKNFCETTGNVDSARSCCVHQNSCTLWGTNEATVCPGSCMDDGDCQNLGNGRIIDVMSCTGGFACNGITSSVGSNSCQGFRACDGAEAPIASFSCNEDRSCLDAAGAIDFGSCNGQGSCRGANGTIESSSCNGGTACFEVSGNVGFGSCNRNQACNLAGIVGDWSCNGVLACNNTVCVGNNITTCESICNTVGETVCPSP